MGEWARGLFGNDTAQDVKDSFEAALKNGMDGKAAADFIMNSGSFRDFTADEEDAPLAWMALASLAFDNGYMNDMLRQQAQEAIEFMRTMETGMTVSLNALERKLRKAPKQPRKPTRAMKYEEIGTWKNGDVYQYQPPPRSREELLFKEWNFGFLKAWNIEVPWGSRTQSSVYVFRTKRTLAELQENVELVRECEFVRLHPPKWDSRKYRGLLSEEPSRWPEARLKYCGHIEVLPVFENEYAVPDADGSATFLWCNLFVKEMMQLQTWFAEEKTDWSVRAQRFEDIETAYRIYLDTRRQQWQLALEKRASLE